MFAFWSILACSDFLFDKATHTKPKRKQQQKCQFYAIKFVSSCFANLNFSDIFAILEVCKTMTFTLVMNSNGNSDSMRPQEKMCFMWNNILNGYAKYIVYEAETILNI